LKHEERVRGIQAEINDATRAIEDLEAADRKLLVASHNLISDLDAEVRGLEKHARYDVGLGKPIDRPESCWTCVFGEQPGPDGMSLCHKGAPGPDGWRDTKTWGWCGDYKFDACPATNGARQCKCVGKRGHTLNHLGIVHAGTIIVVEWST